MTTLAQAVKTIVENSIDRDYIAECGNPVTGAATLASIYEAEYGHNGVTPKACHDYLRGLPSVCTVPFYNGEILETLKQHGIDVSQDEDRQYELIEVYWLECGKQFYMMMIR